MISTKIRIAVITLLIIVLGVACSNSKTDKSAAANLRKDANATLDKAGETINDAGSAIQLQIDQFRKDMNTNIATTDEKLKKLQARRDTMNDKKNRDALDTRLTNLKKQRDDLQLRIDQIDSQPKDQTDWQKFEDETKVAWKDLENGVKDTIDKLGG